MFFPTNTLNWIKNSFGIYAIDVDLGGQDIFDIQLTSFDDCLVLCVTTVSCTHVTYWYSSYGPQGHCWLKYGPRSQVDASSLSGVQSAILNQRNFFKY